MFTTKVQGDFFVNMFVCRNWHKEEAFKPKKNQFIWLILIWQHRDVFL